MARLALERFRAEPIFDANTSREAHRVPAQPRSGRLDICRPRVRRLCQMCFQERRANMFLTFDVEKPNRPVAPVFVVVPSAFLTVPRGTSTEHRRPSATRIMGAATARSSAALYISDAAYQPATGLDKRDCPHLAAFVSKQSISIIVATSWMIAGMSARIRSIVRVPFAQPVRLVVAPYRGPLTS
jgi:hypothetical protein